MAKQYSYRESLAASLEAERRTRGLSYAQAGAAAGIDTAQAMRICNGNFVTLSANVLRLCQALDVEPEGDDLRLPVSGASHSAARLQSEVIAAWDETQEGAENLIVLLRAVRRLRGLADTTS